MKYNRDMLFKVAGTKMIVSASRRTDIPSYYSDWFYNRIKEGFVCVRNPMNAHQISKIDLSPEVVDCIVFWTKNPAPMLERLDELHQYQYYFQFTVTGYGKEVEGNLPAKEKHSCHILSNMLDSTKQTIDRWCFLFQKSKKNL